MEKISEIIHYAIEEMDGTIQQGRDIYEFVEKNLELDSVGLMPIYNNEGYLLLSQEHKKNLSVYRYQMSMLEHCDEQYKTISTTYVSHEIKSLSRTVNQIKLDLIKRFKELPNPATFLITSKFQFPMTETLLPVAKRLLVSSIKLNKNPISAKDQHFNDPGSMFT